MLARVHFGRSYRRYHPPAAARCAALFMATATAMKTYQANAQDRERDWYVVDAAGKTLGRLATQIADVLRGKRKPTYTPHVDMGDFVVVINAEKIAVTGNKREEKTYWRHSGYPGGIKSRTLGEMLERRPEEVIRKAVKGMMPRNRLARQQLTKLKVYAGPEHPTRRSSPKPMEIETDAGRRDSSSADEEHARGRRPGRGAAAPEETPPSEGGEPRDAATAEDAAEQASRGREEALAEDAAEPRTTEELPPRRLRLPAPRRLPPRRRAAEKKKDVIPGADLEPIAVEPERRARAPRRRPAWKPRKRRKRAARRELIGDDERGRAPPAARRRRSESDARFLATGKRKRSIARVILLPGDGKIEVNKRSSRSSSRAPAPDDRQAAARRCRLRGQRRRPRPRPRRRHQRPGRRGPPRHRPGADRDRPRAARRAQAPRLPDPRRAGQGAPQGRAQEGPQAAAVPQALTRRPRERPSASSSGPTGSGGGRDLPHRRAGDGAGPRRHRLAGGRAPAGPDRPRHPRVGPDAGGGAGRRHRRARAATRCSAASCRRPAAAILVRRLGLDLAAVVSASHNPYPRQRDQVLRRAGTKLDDERRGADRGAARRGRRPRTRGRPRARAERRPRGLPARAARRAFPLDLSGRRVAPRLRQRRHPPRRAGDLRAARRRGRGDRGRARRAQHQRRLRLDPPRARWPSGSPRPAPRSASPSTATATACSPSTATGASTTATS